ncbi:MAG: aldo/keto reductase [Alphaproteobacteria bacterium]|nr:aldo/keto reductase [Alphaproteobacteria bacterium]
MTGMTMHRRQLLAGAGAAGAASLLAPIDWAALAQTASAVLRRKIPVSGEMLPVIGIGTAIIFDFEKGDAEKMKLRAEVLRTLVNGGGVLVDTAPSYGQAEARLGDLFAATGLRDKIFLATKARVGSREPTIESFNASYKRMGIDKVELMQLHNPKSEKQDLAVYREWKQQGRTKYIGFSSSFDRDYGLLEPIIQREKPDFFQIDYSMVDRNAEERLIPLARDNGCAILTNLPFGRGRFFAKIKGKPVPEWATKELGVTSWAQYSLKWSLGNEAITAVIPGTDRPEYMTDNLKAGTGPMPDAAMRKKMVDYFDSL